MPRTTRTMRFGARGAAHVDPTDLREVLGDKRTHTAIGLVVQPTGESSHYEIVIDDEGNAEVMLHVALQPEDVPLFCRLGVSNGVWRIPPIGSEVGVIIPHGELEADPFIVCTVEHTVADGLAPNVVVVQADQVLIHDGDAGGCKALVTADVFNAHVHVGVNTGIDQSGIPLHTTSGTDVLKAK